MRAQAGAWVAVAAVVATLGAGGASEVHAGPPEKPVRVAKPAPRNLLLLPGHYDGAIGAFEAPLADMPDANWYVLVKDAAGSYVHRIPDARDGRPLFLRELERATPENSATLQSALGQLFYVNLPRTTLVPGPVNEVPLRRRALSPANGRAYALTLGATPFVLTVNNGMKGRAGAHYVLDVKGVRYEYLLDGFGWDSEVEYAGDLDRDGRPDLVVYVNGNSTGTWYLLLSSLAKPGMNAPTAKLSSAGCCMERAL